MRTEKFNSALLSTLIIVSLMVPAIMLLSASPASAPNPNSDNIIVQGDIDAKNISTEGTPPPWRVYGEGDNPPIMWAEEVGDGRVVAAGFSRMTNGGENYPGKLNWKVGELDVLFDVAFRWMKFDNTEPIKVLWYGAAGENYMVYNDALKASYLIDNLMAKGYEIDNKADAPITSSLLAPYDILVQPGLQIGDFDTGGEPENLLDADVLVIDSFVRAGGGLFIMESGDWDGANFCEVQNKILEKLDFGMRFQMDTVVDPDSLDPTYVREGMGAVFDADVNTDVLFGADYGETKIQVYKVPSLAPEKENYGVFVEISPRYLEGLEGGTLEYTVKVTNVGKITDNYILENSDTLGWDLEISPHVLELENNSEPKYATLRVKNIPPNPLGTEDVVTITATLHDNENENHSAQCVAIVGNRVRPTIADAQVVEANPDKKFGGRGWMYVGSSDTGLFKNEEAFLKFNLKALGAASAENKVRLYLYCFAMMGAPDKTVWLHRVDENWWEDNINYTNKPPLGENLGTATVSDSDLWYSWDVTDYVHEQRDNENADSLASFALSYEIGSGSANYPENWSYGFETKEYSRELIKHPYLAVGRSVRTTTARTVDRELDYEEGLPGGTVSYNVLVQNTGALDDTYTLTVIDNMGWGPKFLATGDNTMPLTLPAGEFDNATVTVTIPTDAPIGENIDNITVIAISDSYPTISDDDWFVASVSNTNIRPPEDDSTAIQGMDAGNWVWGTDEMIYAGRDYGAPERGFLKFDLKAIPSLENIKRARLWLNAEGVDDVGAVVRVHEVENDSWIERGAGRLMWENQGNQPSIGEVLDVRGVVEAGNYFWDVTDFVRDQFENDSQKLASFALVDLGENIPPDIHKASFTSKESEVRDNHPYLEILTTAPELGVRAYISPVFQGGKFGTTLTYTVTVTNTGTDPDSYDLENSDTFGWELTISPSTLSLAAGESDNAMLSITIPSGRICDLDRITVTATGTGVSDSAIAFAHRSEATIGLENLYKIGIDLNIRLREDADKLVAKFYTLGDDNEGEGVVWENIMPWYLDEPKEVPHPWGQVAVKKVRLVLVDDTDAEWLVASFTLNRDALFGRIMGIKGEWPLPGSDRNALFQEIMDIKGLWPIV